MQQLSDSDKPSGTEAGLSIKRFWIFDTFGWQLMVVANWHVRL